MCLHRARNVLAERQYEPLQGEPVKTIELSSWNRGPAALAAAGQDLQRQYWPVGSAVFLAALPLATFDLVENNYGEVPVHLFVFSVTLCIALTFVHAIFHGIQNRAASWPVLSVALSFLPLTYLLFDADLRGYGVSDRFIGTAEVFARSTRYYLLGCGFIQACLYLLWGAHQRGWLSGVFSFFHSLDAATNVKWNSLHPSDPAYDALGPMELVKAQKRVDDEIFKPDAPTPFNPQPAHVVRLDPDAARYVRRTLKVTAIGLIGYACVSYWYALFVGALLDKLVGFPTNCFLFSSITALAGLAFVAASMIVDDQTA